MVEVGGIGEWVLVAVKVSVLVTVGVGGTGVLVCMAVKVSVGGTGVFVRVAVKMDVGVDDNVGVFVGVNTGIPD